jgi:glucosamine--fructose-6-phosphate aminotransferase (isomerizing)
MCGIVGAIARRDVVPVLLDGLRRMEYRGYDSAGIVVVDEAGGVDRVRRAGKVEALADAIHGQLHGTVGVGHTRWATHGAPNEINAHPHVCRKIVALVHNGIIENHEALRALQVANGFEFTSDTDTEVVVHQVYEYHVNEKLDLLDAVRHTVADIRGAYALGVISKQDPQRIIAARFGNPLVIGLGDGENYIASDSAALLPVTRRFIYLQEGDIADITLDGVTVYDAEGMRVERPVHESQLSADATDKGEYAHYMLKEIFEQPAAIVETLEGRIGDARVMEEAFGPDAGKIFDAIQSVQIVACGTSYHAGLIARYGFEALAGIPCNVEVASEYRYRRQVVAPDTLFVTISQSGETADTLAALREARKLGYAHSLAICNVAESSLVRESDLVLMTRAGPEIGVASTKAFTTQLVALLLLIVVLGRRRQLSAETEAKIVQQLRHLPLEIEEVLALNERIALVAKQFADKKNALFLGRGAHYPVALEGALKLKEISYIHAEGYPAGELKHGPLALVDADVPVVAVAPNDDLLDKLKSNLQEVRARGGRLFVFADPASEVRSEDAVTVIDVAPAEQAVSPIVYTIPLQLLAYHVALIRGTDVDKPRNLAKSVTVE